MTDRFTEATGGLDFYHASQHLWAVAHTLYPADEAAARGWITLLLHQLRHGGERNVLKTLPDLPAWCAQREAALSPPVAKEINYFEQHREHLDHAARAA